MMCILIILKQYIYTSSVDEMATVYYLGCTLIVFGIAIIGAGYLYTEKDSKDE